MATGYREPAGMGSPDVECYPRGFLKRISWGAIFAGTIVALVIELTLSLLGMGIGLGVVNPATETNPLGGVGTGAGIWLAVSTLISLFAGGWVASRLAGFPRSSTGILHGIVVWGVVTLFSFYLMTTAVGMLVSGIAGVVGKGISLVGSGIVAMAPPSATRGGEATLDSLMNQARDVFLKGNPAVPGRTDQEVTNALQNLFASGRTPGEADRQTVVKLLVARTNMSRQEAIRTVDTWIQQKAQLMQTAGQAKGTALQITQETMDTLSKAAIWAFVAVVLGAIASAIGGAIGAPKELHTTSVERGR